MKADWLMWQVVMLFPTDFWGEADMFGRVPVGGSRGQYFLFYSYSHISGTCLPCLSVQLEGPYSHGLCSFPFVLPPCDDAERRLSAPPGSKHAPSETTRLCGGVLAAVLSVLLPQPHLRRASQAPAFNV